MNLPTPSEVAKLLGGISGRDVKAAKSGPMNLRSKAKKVYGIYQGCTRDITCVIVWDFELLASAGGAMLAFPACTVQDAIKAGVLEYGLEDTARETLNICSQWFQEIGHFAFQKMIVGMENLPDNAALVLQTPVEREDFSTQISGYGSGQLALIVGPVNPSRDEDCTA